MNSRPAAWLPPLSCCQVASFSKAPSLPLHGGPRDGGPEFPSAEACSRCSCYDPLRLRACGLGRRVSGHRGLQAHLGPWQFLRLATGTARKQDWRERWSAPHRRELQVAGGGPPPPNPPQPPAPGGAGRGPTPGSQSNCWEKRARSSVSAVTASVRPAAISTRCARLAEM